MKRVVQLILTALTIVGVVTAALAVPVRAAADPCEVARWLRTNGVRWILGGVTHWILPGAVGDRFWAEIAPELNAEQIKAGVEHLRAQGKLVNDPYGGTTTLFRDDDPSFCSGPPGAPAGNRSPQAGRAIAPAAHRFSIFGQALGLLPLAALVALGALSVWALFGRRIAAIDRRIGAETPSL